MSNTPPPLTTEQSNSGSDDFELIEKEEGIVSKGSFDAIPDLIQTTQQPESDVIDEISTEQDSNLNNLVGLEIGNNDSLVIIEPVIPTQNIEEIPSKDSESIEEIPSKDSENIEEIPSKYGENIEETIAKVDENIDETIAKVDENTLDSISKEGVEFGVVKKDSQEISPTDREISDAVLLPQERENPEDAISKDSEISQVIPSENREIFDDPLPQERENPEDTISKDSEISQVIPSENREVCDDTLPQDRESPEDTKSEEREIFEQPDSKADESLQDPTSENRDNITEIDSVTNPITIDDVIDKDDAEVMDILLSPKETMDSGLADNAGSPSYLQQQPPLDDDVTETQQQYTDKQIFLDSSDSPDIDNSNSTNQTGEDMTQDDETIQYADRPNSTEAEQDLTSYVYPVEQEFWEVEDLDTPQASQVRWRHLYTQLNLRSSEDPPSQDVARMHQHRPLNRYSNILANDRTRIHLTHPDTQYINANLIAMPEVDRSYIMTQGPLDITCDHFWHMVWHEECPGIVMLNRTVESGKLKCFQYFPKNPGQQLIFGDFLIECLRQFETACYRMSNLQLTHLSTQQTRAITHFQYLSWPDFGAPKTPEDFLQFLVAVRDKGLLNAEGYGPPVIHCSAGVGRSGTFILVDACLRRIEIEGHPLNVHVQDTILFMRAQRYGCIQSDEQLRFSYVAILVATHNLMAEAPIALVPELVERERQETAASPIPPRRTSSRVQIQSEQQSQPPEIPPRIVPRVEPVPDPTEHTTTTSNPDTPHPFEDGIRERIPPEINPAIVETIDEINDQDLQFSKLKITLGLIAVTISVGLFYMTFF